MEIKYNQYTKTYQLIHNGQVLCASQKGEITSDEQAAVWFKEVMRTWLEGLDTKGVVLQ